MYLVAVDGDTRYVIKQPGPSIDRRSSVEAEATVYRWLATEPTLAGVAPRARLSAESRAAALLVLDAIPSAQPLHDLIATLDGQVVPLICRLARLLEHIHAVSAQSGRARAFLPARTPWVLRLAAGSSPDFASTNPAAAAAIAHIRGRPELISLLTRGSDWWQPTAAIHGDVKTDNVLARSDNGHWRVWLIDWELAGWGDPLWDLASLVEGLLTTTVLAAGSPDPDPAIPLLRAATAAYRNLDRDRLVTYVAARLVQVTVQLAAMTSDRDGWAEPRQHLLTLATALSRDPIRAATILCDPRR